jgi:hypothetical protein
LDTRDNIFDVISDNMEKWDIREELFLQGKSVIYDDETISKEYSILEDPLGRKFLITLDENHKLKKVKQIQ